MAGMSGMPMTGSGEQGADAVAPAPAPRERGSGHRPCERAAATTTCQLFASCAAGFVAADRSLDVQMPRRLADPRVIELLTPSSRTVAPELPPPRA